ncbi:hypothetical protein FRC19_000906 [Serendipita sp. 401]|nr:hypothetical protein FRC19_000906 [Serendipita sp. 401]KAG9043504.1 hypothetical protein FS842_001795 [Serendipita sp. 407]
MRRYDLRIHDGSGEVNGRIKKTKFPLQGLSAEGGLQLYNKGLGLHVHNLLVKAEPFSQPVQSSGISSQKGGIQVDGRWRLFGVQPGSRGSSLFSQAIALGDQARIAAEN